MRQYLREVLQAFLMPYTRYDYAYAMPAAQSWDKPKTEKADPIKGAWVLLKGILGGGNDSPKIPAPAPITPAPTVDEAQQNVQADTTAAQKKGALASFLNTSTGSTGSDLSSSAPETTLKRFLGS